MAEKPVSGKGSGADIPEQVAAAILQAAATMAVSVQADHAVPSLDSDHDAFTKRLIDRYRVLFR